MSRYYVDKFLYEVDRDPALLAEYKSDPAALVGRWEHNEGRLLGISHTVETTSWLSFTDEERQTLIDHDYVGLFEMGVNCFLTLTIFIALYDDDFTRRSGPLSFQREYARKLAHWTGRSYPSEAL
ncbi:MAG: hypothetical protein J2P23_03920 [Microlunatus sp.]|nr:hypothetical protein [Microlunatus sp.]